MPLDAEAFRQHALDVLEFWRAHAVDREFGGFIPQLDRQGRVYDDSQKHLVAMTRLIYTFSQGVLLGGPPWCADLARRGADFLRQHFWDGAHGGWYWCCRRLAAARTLRPGRRGSASGCLWGFESLPPATGQAGGAIRDDCKRTYGHDFAILALTEFHRACGTGCWQPVQAGQDTGCEQPVPHALALAERTFDVMEEHLWDPSLGAYREGRDRAWTTVDPPWLGQNPQMHALEALLALHEVTGEARYRARIADLCRLLDAHLAQPEHGCIPEEFHLDWTVDRTRRDDRISVGHQFEWAWLLMRAEAVVPEAVSARRIDQLMDFAVRHGVDDEFGGVYTHVSSAGQVLNDRKGFWENSEAVMALLWYARRTGEGRYLDLFERTAHFCFAHLADRAYGSWFGAVARDGALLADTKKGGPWKADYHVVQMCAEVYRSWTSESSRNSPPRSGSGTSPTSGSPPAR